MQLKRPSLKKLSISNNNSRDTIKINTPMLPAIEAFDFMESEEISLEKSSDSEMSQYREKSERDICDMA